MLSTSPPPLGADGSACCTNDGNWGIAGIAGIADNGGNIAVCPCFGFDFGYIDNARPFICVGGFIAVRLPAPDDNDVDDVDDDEYFCSFCRMPLIGRGPFGCCDCAIPFRWPYRLKRISTLVFYSQFCLWADVGEMQWE